MQIIDSFFVNTREDKVAMKLVWQCAGGYPRAGTMHHVGLITSARGYMTSQPHVAHTGDSDGIMAGKQMVAQ